MVTNKGLKRSIFLISILMLILFSSSFAAQKAAVLPSAGHEAAVYAAPKPTYNFEVPIYEITLSESTQRSIWELCEENNFSYELALAIFETEGSLKNEMNTIKAEIEKLVSLRDYWATEGYPDEAVFDLVLLSKNRGLEGCIEFIEDNDSYHLDSYVQKVTEYKYYLEQMAEGNECLLI